MPSATAGKAHELGCTRNWVVLYFDGDRHIERQRTIVTERRRPMAGRGVVRGREAECRSHYAAEATAAG